MPNEAQLSNFVCGRFLMFRDGTVEARIVESGTRTQCAAIAADPPADLDASTDGWVRAQHFKVMTDFEWNDLIERADRYEGTSDAD